MKKSKFTDSQIMDALKRAEAGPAVPEICRELGISTATFYNWRGKYGGMDVSLMARMKELEAENARLRKMYVEEKIKAEIVADALAKKTEAIFSPRDGQRRSSTPRGIDSACMRGIWRKPDVLSL
jgi:putative transposase